MATEVLRNADRFDSLTSTVNFTNKAGAPTNPSTVTYSVIDPTGPSSQTDYVFGTDTEVTNPNPGEFVLDLTVTISGDYLIRCLGTGAVAEAVIGIVVVKPDPFTP